MEIFLWSGAFLVYKKIYVESGMENENFYGWGPEDMERVKRMEYLKTLWVLLIFTFVTPRLNNFT